MMWMATKTPGKLNKQYIDQLTLKTLVTGNVTVKGLINHSTLLFVYSFQLKINLS